MGTCCIPFILARRSDIAYSIDLDIESGPSAHYDTFVNTLRSLAKGAPKK